MQPFNLTVLDTLFLCPWGSFLGHWPSAGALTFRAKAWWFEFTYSLSREAVLAGSPAVVMTRRNESLLTCWHLFWKHVQDISPVAEFPPMAASSVPELSCCIGPSQYSAPATQGTYDSFQICYVTHSHGMPGTPCQKERRQTLMQDRIHTIACDFSSPFLKKRILWTTVQSS